MDNNFQQGNVEESLQKGADPSILRDNLTDYKHNEWSKGENCPECGHDKTDTETIGLVEDVADGSVVKCSDCGCILHASEEWGVDIVLDDFSPYQRF